MLIQQFKRILYGLSFPIQKKIRKLQNKHQGEECYLFGDGISIKWFELDHFKDKISISVGYLPFHNDFYKLNTEYCLLVEPNWFYPFVKTYITPSTYIVNHIQSAYRKCISKNLDKNFIVSLSNFPVLNGPNITHLFYDLPNSDIVIYFRKHNIEPFHGSLRASILMAIYMGFSKVYLVGYDYTHSPSRSMHWYEKGRGLDKEIKDYNQDFFSIALNFIEIITVTVDKKSYKLKSVTYKELTGENPIYKENHEIISTNYLKILSSWPNYDL